MLENKIWAQNLNFWNLNIYPQIGVFLLSPSNSYQDRKMKTRGWSPTEFVWRLCQICLLKMAPRTKELQCFHIKWTHCKSTRPSGFWKVDVKILSISRKKGNEVPMHRDVNLLFCMVAWVRFCFKTLRKEGPRRLIFAAMTQNSTTNLLV